ncbi:hypothetical protein [Natrinema versiforme]|nr:hypothetical protein [Natrinema versiforme]
MGRPTDHGHERTFANANRIATEPLASQGETDQWRDSNTDAWTAEAVG